MKEPGFFNRWIRRFITFHIIAFGWIIFRAQSWENFLNVLNSLADLTYYVANIGVVLWLVLGFGYLIQITPPRLKRFIKMQWVRYPGVIQGVVAALVTVFLYNIAVADIKPFIYFQF